MIFYPFVFLAAVTAGFRRRRFLFLLWAAAAFPGAAPGPLHAVDNPYVPGYVPPCLLLKRIHAPVPHGARPVIKAEVPRACEGETVRFQFYTALGSLPGLPPEPGWGLFLTFHDYYLDTRGGGPVDGELRRRIKVTLNGEPVWEGGAEGVPPWLDLPVRKEDLPLRFKVELVITAKARSGPPLCPDSDSAFVRDPEADLEGIWTDVFKKTATESMTVPLVIMPEEYCEQGSGGDPDGDGLSNSDEFVIGSSGLDSDTDGDGLSDSEEIGISGTDPLSPDSDGDGIFDGWEIDNGFDPLEPDDAETDLDGDGLTGSREFSAKTDPHNPDSDGDGMPDGWEVQHGLDPLDPGDAALDPDGDSVISLDEYRFGADPRRMDSAGDGIPDFWKILIGADPMDETLAERVSHFRTGLPYRLEYEHPFADRDGDGLADAAEQFWGASADNADSDGDGMPDGWEAAHGLDPHADTDRDADMDRDGLTNLEEYQLGMLPYDYDSDGDGLGDGWEREQSLNPKSLLNGLTDWWRLDCMAENIVFDSRWPFSDGILRGSATVVRDEVLGKGVLELRRKNSYAAFADRGQERFRGGEFTIAFQYRPAAGFEDHDHEQQLLAQEGLFRISLRGGKLHFSLRDSLTGGLTEIASPEPLAAGEWTHCAVTAGTEAVQLFINGIPSGSGSAPDWAHEGSRPLIAGCPREIPEREPHGRMSDLRLYERVLLPDEIGWLADPEHPDREENRKPAGSGLTLLEKFLYGLDTAASDTDGDGLSDFEEIYIRATDPHHPDTDRDGLEDGEEVLTHGTDPLHWDSDGDSLSDFAELEIYLTDPWNPDTDGDSAPDGWEAEYRLSPLDPQDITQDPDGDGIANGCEYIDGTNPRVANPRKMNEDGTFSPCAFTAGPPGPVRAPMAASPPEQDVNPSGPPASQFLLPMHVITEVPAVHCSEGEECDPPPVIFGERGEISVRFPPGARAHLAEGPAADSVHVTPRIVLSATDANGDGISRQHTRRGRIKYDPARHIGEDPKHAYDYGSPIEITSFLSRLPRDSSGFVTFSARREVDPAVIWISDPHGEDDSDEPEEDTESGPDPEPPPIDGGSFDIHVGGVVVGPGSGSGSGQVLLGFPVPARSRPSPGGASGRALREQPAFASVNTYSSSAIYLTVSLVDLDVKEPGSEWTLPEEKEESPGAIIYARESASGPEPKAKAVLLAAATGIPGAQRRLEWDESLLVVRDYESGAAASSGIVLEESEGLRRFMVFATEAFEPGLSAGVLLTAFDEDGQSLGEDRVNFVRVKIEMIPDYNRDGVIDGQDRAASLRKDEEGRPLPFRFWVNDDSDQSGEVGGSDVPASPKHDAVRGGPGGVDGMRDLVDFFPLLIDIRGLPPDAAEVYEAELLMSGTGMRFIRFKDSHPGFAPHEAGLYLRDVPAARALANAVSRGISSRSDWPTSLAERFLQLALKGRGVLLMESFKAAEAPLKLHLILDGKEAAAAELPLHTSGVEEMFEHIDLTWAPKTYGGKETSPPVPPAQTRTGAPNWPDALTNGKTFVFLHGYNVDGKAARGWHAEIFKRLHQLGSNARFVGVTWHGATRLDYHKAVFHAFQTGDVLTEALAGRTGDVTVAAHSLGNMAVSQAIQNGKFRPARYYMINAAVPIEAYSFKAIEPDMIERDWTDIGAEYYSAVWHQNFQKDADRRAELTWRNLFSSLPKRTVVHNFYSPGEDVLAKHTTVNDASILGRILRGEFNLSRGAWKAQELVKGKTALDSAITVFMDRSQAGWRRNSDYTSGADITLIPRFQPFLEEVLTGADLSAASTKAGEKHVQYDLLARALPALSYAAAVDVIPEAPKEISIENIDVETLGRDSEQWPNEDHRGDASTRWLHSDFKNVALPYVYPMYQLMIEKGSLYED